MADEILRFQGIAVTLTTKSQTVYEGIVNGIDGNLVRLILANNTTIFIRISQVESITYNPDFLTFSITATS